MVLEGPKPGLDECQICCIPNPKYTNKYCKECGLYFCKNCVPLGELKCDACAYEEYMQTHRTPWKS